MTTLSDPLVPDVPAPPGLAMIAARAKNGVIGAGGTLPWHISADLKFFKAQTIGRTVIMGRKTYESIGRPLPKRSNIVVSRTQTRGVDGVDYAPSLEAALTLAADGETLIIGGGALYREAMPLARRLILTDIDLEVDGDTYFPDIDRTEWLEVWSHSVAATDAAPALTFRILDRA